MNTVELAFRISGTDRELLLARLIDAGFEAFEERDEELLAFLPEGAYNEEIQHLVAAGEFPHTVRLIPQQNWNAEWESSFQPVIVPGFCTVRATFHASSTDTPYEVVVTPKMSFGTGHHATTRMMMRAMQECSFQGLSVLDFGTGTGILAILASKLGAASVVAIDNDAWSVENAVENVLSNGTLNVIVAQGSLDAGEAHAPYQVILANINRHILLEYMHGMHNMLTKGGMLILSGILTADEAIIADAAFNAGFAYRKTLNEGDWIAMIFTA